MGENSIKSNLPIETSISETILLVNANHICLIVEGAEDYKFWKKFIITENVKIIRSYAGKHGVEKIVDQVNHIRAIGVRDKDYCTIKNQKRIFFYDRCCMEMMIISADEVYDSLCSEFLLDDPSSKNIEKIHILRELFTLSKLRKYNEEKCKGISFQGLDVYNFVDNRNKLDLSKAKEKLSKLNPNKTLDLTIDDVQELTIDNLLDITNGHDFIGFFKGVCDNYNQRSVDVKHLSSALRVAYNLPLFKDTNLYQSIIKYSENNCLKILL